MIGKDEVINDDLFVGGATVTVDGTVNGDLITMGQTVVINGKVTGDVLTAGSVRHREPLDGPDVFAAGAAVTMGPGRQAGRPQCLYGGRQRGEPGGQPDRRLAAHRRGPGPRFRADHQRSAGRRRPPAPGRHGGSRTRSSPLTPRTPVSQASAWYSTNVPPMPYVPGGPDVVDQSTRRRQPGIHHLADGLPGGRRRVLSGDAYPATPGSAVVPGTGATANHLIVSVRRRAPPGRPAPAGGSAQRLAGSPLDHGPGRRSCGRARCPAWGWVWSA